MSSDTVLVDPTVRERCRQFIENGRVQRTLLALILINAVIFGMETMPTVMAAIGVYLLMLDKAIFAVFVLEKNLTINSSFFCFAQNQILPTVTKKIFRI